MITAAVQEREHYLNASYGIKSWLLTKDHKRIALLYLATVTLFFFIGGAFATLIRLELLTPTGDLVSSETYNKLFTMHGVVMIFFFLIPSIPATLGNFFLPMMIGAKDLAFPRINLLSWYLLRRGRTLRPLRHAGRRCRYRLDVLHAVQHHLLQHLGHRHGARHLHRRVLVHPHRPQLHRHRPPHARARHDLVPHAPVRLGALRHQPHPGPRHAGARHHPGPGALRAAHAPRHLRPGPRRRPGALPAPLLVLLPPGRLHHDPAGHGRGQRAHLHLLPQADLRLQLHRLLERRHRRSRLPRLGPPHVRQHASRSSPAWSSPSSASSSPSPPPSRSSTGRPRYTRDRSRFATPMLYAFGFIGLFTIGGLTGLFLASLGIDVHVTDTYFVVAHFHYIMVGGAIMGYLGGLHYWWPKMTGRMYPEGWASSPPSSSSSASTSPSSRSSSWAISACRAATTSTRPSSRCCTCSPPPALPCWQSATSFR